MFKKLSVILFSVASLLLAQTPPDAKELVNRGVSAFKTSNYSAAVEAFQKAVETDPSFLTAHVYLATAYMQQYVPGRQSSENANFASAAFHEFNRALELDPSNKVAVASIASLNLNMKQWDAAQEWYEKLAVMDPSNAEAAYTIGFIAWTKWYPPYMEARKALGMKQEDPGPFPASPLKADLKARYSQLLEHGLQSLDKALAINPQYSDAMAYMNLLIRERADLVDTKAEYQAEIAVADDWVHKALASKQQKAESMPAVPQRITVGSNVQAAQLLSKVAPVGAGSGEVAMSIVIGKDGHVIDFKVTSGLPMLIQPAIDAVRQWVYRPTLLNGQPVEVATTVTLTFPN